MSTTTTTTSSTIQYRLQHITVHYITAQNGTAQYLMNASRKVRVAAFVSHALLYVRMRILCVHEGSLQGGLQARKSQVTLRACVQTRIPERARTSQDACPEAEYISYNTIHFLPPSHSPQGVAPPRELLAATQTEHFLDYVNLLSVTIE